MGSCDIDYTLAERSPTAKHKHLAIPESDSKRQAVEILCHDRSNKISEIKKASDSVSHQGKNPQEHIPTYQFPTSLLSVFNVLKDFGTPIKKIISPKK